MQIEGSPDTFTCPACGTTYAKVTKLDMDFWTMLGVFILGGLTLGAFIWAPLGRKVAVEAVSRGAAVTTAKVEEWLAKGD